MELFQRILDLNDLLKRKSHFLFGPRSVGKTTLIERTLPGALIFDLLDNSVYSRLIRRPSLITEEAVPGQIIVIDEIQKYPPLLDEVQRAMKTHNNRFLLTGSSARKLKHGAGNLLGGRAWQAHLHPLTRGEISFFDLTRYLNSGGIPFIYVSDHPAEELAHYADLYLREEIVAEALSRNIGYFVRFLDIMALGNGEELSFQGLASDCGVPARTVQNYVQILEDTLMGFTLPPFLSTKKRKAITRSKFYFFDVGVVNHLAKRGEVLPKSDVFGRAFEHFIVMEMRAYLAYARRRLPLTYWRSTSGFEVDAIVGDKLAVEIKSTDLISEKHTKGLRSFKEEGLVRDYAVVSLDLRKRDMDGVTIYPWTDFLDRMWRGELF